MKKIIALLLSAVMIVFVVTACASGTPAVPGDTSGKGGDTSSGADTSVPKEENYGNVPLSDRDKFEGKEFRIATYKGGNVDIYWACFFDVDEPDESDRLQADAHKRNVEIEEKFGCEITCDENWTWAGYKDGKAYMYQLAGDGDMIYDLYFLEGCYAMSDFIIDGMLYDVSTLPYVNLDADYYHHQFNKTFEMKSKNYIFSSDLTYPCHSAQRIYVNEDMLVNLNYDENYLYDLVDDGSWTLDVIFRMMDGLHEDLNHDGIMDINDRYGFSGMPGTPLHFFSGAGLRGSYITDNGWEFDYGSDKAIKVVDRLKTFCDSPDTYLKEWTYDPFLKGNALFTNSGAELRQIKNWDLDMHIGILPNPKYDESQERYYNMCQGGPLIVPSDIKDPEFVGAMIEAMSYGSQKYLVPAFYDNFVQQRIIQDDRSRENWRRMLTEWSVFEFTYLIAPNEDLQNFGPAMFPIFRIVDGEANTYSSSWAEVEDVMKLVCNQFYKKFMSKV